VLCFKLKFFVSEMARVAGGQPHGCRPADQQDQGEPNIFCGGYGVAGTHENQYLMPTITISYAEYKKVWQDTTQSAPPQQQQQKL